jgi:thiol-disulfide isomerase/thioredoxin
MLRNLKRVLKPEYVPVAIILILAILMVYFFSECKEGMECSHGCTMDELKKAEKSPEKTLVLFYADWCGHCKKLEPDWDKSAETVKGRMLKRNVGAKEGECSPTIHAENEELMEKYNIKGFPTIIIFQDGKAVPYDGPRKVDELLNLLE